MSDNTKIEWTKPSWVTRGATWNPVTGCTQISAACEHCYAKRDWKRLSANPKATKYFGRAFTDVQCHPEVLDQPLRWKNPRGVFVNSMSDLFHEALEFEYIAAVFGVMAQADQHTFMVLTKRPHRMLEFFKEWVEQQDGNLSCPGDECRDQSESLGVRPDKVGHRHWPLPNVWLGVTVEDQAAADERIPLLLQTPAAVRFVSCEPLLGPIDLSEGQAWLWRYDDDTGAGFRAPSSGHGGIDWVIAGGESGPHARPSHPDWFRSLRDQCAGAGTPFFFKQWGEWCGDTDSADLSAPEQADPDEYFREHRFGDMDIDEAVYRTGKKRAGRYLDGVEYSEFPEMVAS